MSNFWSKRPDARRIVHLSLIITLFSGLPLHPLTAQVGTAGIQEEQDYAFAFGLYQDKLYQLASDQFQKFIDRYPASAKHPDAIFLYAECQYAMGNFDEAISVLKSFAREFPRHKLRPDALFRLGEANFKLHHFADAIPFYKEIVESYGLTDLAGEASYWIGEAYFKADDMASASKYYTISAEKYPQISLLTTPCIHSGGRQSGKKIIKRQSDTIKDCWTKRSRASYVLRQPFVSVNATARAGNFKRASIIL